MNLCDMSVLLEQCCCDAEAVRRALERGAGRVELCERIDLGGITPRETLIRDAVSVGLPVNVLVRPRGGDFVFTEDEVLAMLESIELCGRTGAAGVVVGALHEDGSVDMDTMKRLVHAARSHGLSVTFHRAFDVCAEPQVALEQIIELGCDRLLTSGQAATALEGVGLIAELVRQAAGRLIVMPGAGVRPSNLEYVREKTGAVEFHGTAVC